MFFHQLKLKFFKTHNALCNINGNAFTNEVNTAGCIYIVRDPRDIIVSASKYYSLSQEETKTNMFNENMDLINDIEDCNRSLQNSQEADQSEESIREISETRRLQECLEKMK